VPIALNATALAIAIIYFEWRDSYRARLLQDQLLRARILRERVTFLLWSAAQRIP
jgi:hypothetical protein